MSKFILHILSSDFNIQNISRAILVSNVSTRIARAVPAVEKPYTIISNVTLHPKNIGDKHFDMDRQCRSINLS